MPSLSEAIHKKYGKEDAQNVEFGLPIEIYVPKTNPRNCMPSLLVLNDCDIESAGDEEELDEMCQIVEDLDLAQNKLEKWSEIFGILTHMPRLKFVNLSFNNLHSEILTTSTQNIFPFLRNLVLNGTLIEWKSVRTLLRLLPSLEELHLSLNAYSYVDLDPAPYATLRRLHFMGNPVHTWLEVCKLGAVFPELESLVLADCPLASLDVPEEREASPGGRTESESELCQCVTCPHACFARLHFLNLNNCLLSSWSEVERLSRFPALRQLRLSGCPLFEDYTEQERRQLLIARLPNVEVLNGGGVITDEEREDAERAFIRHYMDKPESDRPERYGDLVSVHGQLQPLVSIDLSPKKKVRITFRCGERADVRCISVYQTVQELKHRLEEFSGICTAKMRLFYLDQDLRAVPGCQEEMRFPTRQLYRYNMASGDEILVESKP
ncbi:tubulin-specific chaperone cofactor E-like protein [Bacillus rossius redtenbacheri]|uniref:tubulin-specific chaperone cofactor E-like protein n=1 Tax=Bacillus rossius redtenbacheri TaxID=93214 RepID=UPI002FDD8B68